MPKRWALSCHCLTNPFMQFWRKNPLIFGHVGGKNKKMMKSLFFFSSGIISLRRRTSSTKQYSESCLYTGGVKLGKEAYFRNPLPGQKIKRNMYVKVYVPTRYTHDNKCHKILSNLPNFAPLPFVWIFVWICPAYLVFRYIVKGKEKLENCFQNSFTR